jgi:hypothetical protein
MFAAYPTLAGLYAEKPVWSSADGVSLRNNQSLRIATILSPSWLPVKVRPLRLAQEQAAVA